MPKSSSGFVTDSILLSIGRAILRKQLRENRRISDVEVHGHAMVLQGRYNFVHKRDENLFGDEVVRSFRYVEQRGLKSVDRLAFFSFQKDELSGNSILDTELINDLQDSGFTA
ncbi:hypothetical protein C9J44_10760 [Photobacterium sp. GB-27]|uniref:hypothetical protein n=1 Tax=Photobacterium sp. GB-27 TaxID=2022109 RepID=UPI000D1567C6|nr:hypothetical protein [Photobacterium sp. GB-27]PSV36102.1 hypothetical protein C9J44_10760 [Photobacterium sp. GB-27]